ncbi:MAG: zinc ABC transporter substrate-binding protein [Lachnospiraceae bacterium]|nr:zinc ABC transporter substrate-binding protein [Lachnospiraceae bacterium]
MNKILKMISILMLATVITGCGGSGGVGATQSTGENGAGATQFAGGNGATGEDRLQVVTTIFPIYDWARQVVGAASKDVDVMLLVENGVDMHSFQPTASDLMTIADCDLFLYVGGESDEWVEEALMTAANPDRVTLKLIDVLGDAALEEEIAEGMEHDHDEHDHKHDKQSADTTLSDDVRTGEASQKSEHPVSEANTGMGAPIIERQLDEHVWLSLKNAQVLTKAIAESLANVNPSNADMYFENQAAYAKKLAALDAEYEEVIKNAQRDTLLFGDRFPFRYLLNDYGVSYYAAFPGCSSETEASFETVRFLANKTKELELNCVLTIEGSDNRIAQTIIDSADRTDCKTLTLDSMQSVTKDDIENGVTYLSVMEENLEVLKEALQ